MTTAPESTSDVSSSTASKLRASTLPLVWLELAMMIVLLGAVMLARPVDPDFWWHLAMGDIMLDSGIPERDPFSWTAESRPWVAHEWLSELAIATTQSLAGYGGNVLLFTAAAAAAVLLMYATGRRMSASPPSLVVTTLVASFVLVFFLTVRPQVFTWLLFAVFLAVLSGHERRDSRVLLALPAIMLLWANLHLGFVYGLMLVAIWCGSRAIHASRGEQVSIVSPVLIAVACAVATLANPQGYEIWLYPVRYYQDRESFGIVAEWQSPLKLNLFLVPYSAIVLLAVGSIVSKRRPSLFVALVAVAVLALSLLALRSVPFLALVVIPVAGRALSSTVSLARQPRIRVTLATPLFLVLVTLAVIASTRSAGGWGALDDPSDDNYPAQGVGWIERETPAARLYNDYSWGGYLAYTVPDVPVFIDGRTDFYRAAILDDYTSIARVEEEWQSVLDEYGVDTVLIRKDSRLADELRLTPGWVEAFTGSIESVFVRSGP